VANPILVREKLSTILTPRDLTDLETTATHRALLTLAKGRDGQTRLITTNFDRILHAVDPNLQYFSAPLLPIPKRSRWDGLVYLHGLLPEPEDVTFLTNLVLSSGDFGLAYLTERWASRFVTELFKSYTVCFVGYSIEDPVLRYMMDALSADRMRGEESHEVYAFGSCQSGRETEADQAWKAKGVTPILYLNTDGHHLLHKTLRTWAEIYRDGLTGKRSVIREATGFPSPVHGDGQISRVLWAITDPSGLPAKTFAELNPAPPVEWLKIFTERCFTHANLQQFGIFPSSPTVNQLSFSLLNRPTSHEQGPWMALCNNFDPVHRTAAIDEVMFQIARWLVRHLAGC